MNRLRAAFIAIAFWIAFGLFLDFLIGTKQFFYLADSVRRETWRLAHAHGTLLMLVYAVFSKTYGIANKQNDNLMFLGALVMPLGFLLGGIRTTETDPFVMVVLVPIGGLCFLTGLIRSLK